MTLGVQLPLKLEFGCLALLLAFSDDSLSLVKVRYGCEQVSFLTNALKGPTLKRVFRPIEAYLNRWRLEEAIQSIKQSYSLEDVRL